jgi:aldehyde dehydrogenase (NAD+)
MTGESRLLIDGKLTAAASGRTFDNINPATEEVLGQTADAELVDLDTAIAKAREAFDESTWSTDRALRQRGLLQLQEALEREKEEIRAELVAEAGCPVATTYMAQLDMPLADALRWPAAAIDEFGWERDLPTGSQFGSLERAVSVASRLKAGTISVNGGIYYGADSPFGGRKASGMGRQNGFEGFEQYLETKAMAGLLES